MATAIERYRRAIARLRSKALSWRLRSEADVLDVVLRPPRMDAGFLGINAKRLRDYGAAYRGFARGPMPRWEDAASWGKTRDGLRRAAFMYERAADAVSRLAESVT